MKLAGAVLIIMAGYLTGLWILRPYKEHIALLQEGNHLFCLMDSEVRHRKIPLTDLAARLSGKTESAWRLFFLQLGRILEEKPDQDYLEIFEQLLEWYPGNELTAEERKLFFRFGEAILTGDHTLQRDCAGRFSTELMNDVMSLRKELKNREKVIRIFCTAMSILVIIILI